MYIPSGIAELHLHLYGCFTPEDLYQRGCELRGEMPRWDWFQQEYTAACGKSPTHYWTHPQGQKKLAEEILLRAPASFAQFQSRFNLSIALFPALDPATTRIALRRAESQGIVYGEFRMVIPPHFTEPQGKELLTLLGETFLACTHATFTPKLLISLPGFSLSLTERHYRWIQETRITSPALSQVLVGLDFCGDEESQPPLEKEAFFRQLHDDNHASSRSLLACYHVGECFSHIGMDNSIRRIWQTHSLGVHRLSHASALGIPPAAMAHRPIRETATERSQHLQFLLKEHEWLQGAGMEYDLDAAQKELDVLEARPHHTPYVHAPSAQEVENTQCLQQAVLTKLREAEACIESCPRSNFILSGIKNLTDHPLRKLAKSGVRLVIASDDPGIFDTSYTEEEAFCRNELGLSEDTLQGFREEAQHQRIPTYNGVTSVKLK